VLRGVDRIGADYDLAACEPGDLDPHAVASVFKAYFRECKFIACLVLLGVNATLSVPEHMLTSALLPYFEGIVEQETVAAGTATESNNPRNADVKSAGRGLGLPSGPRPGSLPPGMKKPPSLSTLAMPTFKDIPPPSISLIRALRALVSQLPEENRDLLRTLVDVINATSSNEKATKMPLANLVLVFYPSVQITPPLLRVLCETKGIWGETPPVMDVKRENSGSSASSRSDIYSDAPDGVDERESLSGDARTSEDHMSSLSDYQASAEESIDPGEGLARRRPSPRPRRAPESTVYMDAECRCSSASLLLHPLSGSVDSSRDNSSSSPNALSPSSTPPMTSSAESLVTPATSSGQPSLPHLPIDEGKKREPEQDLECISDVVAPESTKYIISDSMSHAAGPVHFPSLPSSPLKRRSTPLLSIPHANPMNAPHSAFYEPPSPTASLHSNSSLSRRLKLKKPSLSVFLSSKHSNSSLQGISKTNISNPIINSDSFMVPHSASDSSVSTPQSAVTAPQESAYILPPPFERSPFAFGMGIQVTPSGTEDSLTAESAKNGTPIADRHRADSTTSSAFYVTRSARSTPEPTKTSHLRPTPRRPATSSSNHLGILDRELDSSDDWTHSVLLAADIEHDRVQGEKR
jgi:hypothetical protein